MADLSTISWCHLAPGVLPGQGEDSLAESKETTDLLGGWGVGPQCHWGPSGPPGDFPQGFPSERQW